MRTVITATQLKKEWDGRPLFEGVSVEVKEGERVALFGRNGCGKTTLLRMLLGQTAADGGTISRAISLDEFGLLEQRLEDEVTALSLLELVYSSDPERAALKRELDSLQAELQSGGEAVFGRYARVLDLYVEADGYAWENEAERMLLQLGLPHDVWNLPYSSLSGGQKTRAQLARMLLRGPKLLVLDEPTNHLDLETLEWLEEWLDSYKGTVLFVSHDRRFIDRIASAVYELTPSGGTKYPGGYTRYREQKEIERREQETLYRKQQHMREELQESIRMYAQWYRQADRDASSHGESKASTPYWKARAAKHTARMRAKEKELERLERDAVKKPREASQLKLMLEGSEHRGETMLRLEDVSFAWPKAERKLFENLTLWLKRGDRLAVLGPNGSGKSTLLRLIVGGLQPVSGQVVLNPQTKIGYFSQELEVLQPEQTILDSLLSLPGMQMTAARTILGCFLFSGEDVYRPIGCLSMGERCRVAFLRLYFSGANLLVLDEPTNYLDIDTRERVEEALASYTGALVLVSHDRHLVSRLANRLLYVSGDGRVRQVDDGLAEHEEDFGV